MKTITSRILVTFFLIPILSFGQEHVNITFDTTTVKLSRTNKDQIVPVIVSIDSVAVESPERYELSIEVDNSTTLSTTEYDFKYKKIKLSELLKKEKLFITINKDTLPDRVRKVVLTIKIYKDGVIANLLNNGKDKTLSVLVSPSTPDLKGYEYLGYLGTNFDLVEGIQTKDLFFAANILNSPERTIKKNVGFYLSIYGNRAISRSDSTSVIRTSSAPIDTISDNVIRVIEQTGRALETQTTDNLGAYISPLFQWPFKKRENSNTRLYLAPSLEFVYRRTRLTTSPLNISRTDTISTSINPNEIEGRERRPRSTFGSSQTINEYSFNAGIGLFLAHENERISVRVHGSVGYASNYYGDLIGADRNPLKVTQCNDIFFSGRAWITESVSGVTLQAEVTNSLFQPRPFFVATLSKAFDFKDLGSFFSPITKRK